MLSRIPSECCISFDSYIKPQHDGKVLSYSTGCISFDSYIKPQLCCGNMIKVLVVYLLIPTSNHNLITSSATIITLYIF